MQVGLGQKRAGTEVVGRLDSGGIKPGFTETSLVPRGIVAGLNEDLAELSELAELTACVYKQFGMVLVLMVAKFACFKHWVGQLLVLME